MLHIEAGRSNLLKIYVNRIALTLAYKHKLDNVKLLKACVKFCILLSTRIYLQSSI